MHVVLRVGGGWLEVGAAAAGLEARRAVNADDAARFGDWTTRYRALLGRDAAEVQLLALGREMYAWLDGGERWLERLLAAAEPPVVVEFQAPALPDELARVFLQAPWELLASTEGHLAGDAVLRYCPVRRLGPASDPPALTDHCFSALCSCLRRRVVSTYLTSRPKRPLFSMPRASLASTLSLKRAAIRPAWPSAWPTWRQCRCYTCPATVRVSQSRCCC